MPSRTLVALLLAAGTFAQAQEQPRKLRPFLSLAWTTGGDTLATATYTDGSSSSIKAGGETLFRGGLDFQVNPQFSLQVSYGFHTDSAKEAKNGDLEFKRNVVEADAFWHPAFHHRLGLGFRKASDARVRGSGAVAMNTIDFDASTGTVLQWEYLSNITPIGRGGFSLRYVMEKYTPTQIEGFGPVTGPSVSGDHFGIGFSWYF